MGNIKFVKEEKEIVAADGANLRLRAIENGKYILRSSNNGMAAIINPLGQIEKKIDYGETSYIDFNKRRDLNATIFSILGNAVFILLILMYIFFIISFNRFSDE